MKLNSNTTKILFCSLSSVKHFPSLSSDLDQYLVSELTFLGFTIAKDLTWSAQVKNTIKKLSTRLHFLRVLKNSLSKSQLVQVYYGFVQSLLDYLFPLI